MPNLIWSKLKPMQLGRYAEYYAKMEFASYGFDVYTSEVDDHGVDFVAKPMNSNDFYEVQVKSSRNFTYVFIPKAKMPIMPNRLVCYLHFIEEKLPEVYIIPATEWLNPNAVLVDRNYNKVGQKSKPEWGINISHRNIELLRPYITDNIIKTITTFEY